MTKPDSLKVDLGKRSYNILVAEDLLKNAGKYIKPLLPVARTYTITDENVASLHLKKLEKSLKENGIENRTIILPAGEKTKSFKFLEKVCEDILAENIERKVTLIAFGGGVIGDLTGFVASILLRGINFIQIPTTLLAMVDSSVGGKTGINTKSGKNLAGSFHQPRLVLADISLLDSLPKREFLAGYAEVVKYGLIDNEKFFGWLEKNLPAILKHDRKALRHIVLTSCKSKAVIVAKDEKESDVRALLNLGHTFAHALELEAGYSGKLLHGEAVSIGMVMAFEFSYFLGLCKKSEYEKVRKHLQKAGLPVEVTQKITAKTMTSHIKKDKKVDDGKLTFILAHALGQSFIAKDIKDKKLMEFLAIGLG